MTRRAIPSAAICIAFVAAAVDPQLRVPLLGDPSRMYGYSQTKWHDVATLFMPGGHDAVTAVAWTRMQAPADEFAAVFKRGVMFGACTVEPARATAEGGAALPDLLGDAYTGETAVPLNWAGRKAFSNLLPDYVCPPGLAASWQHGCYCINLRTDTPLTLTVGGAEIAVTAATNMVRNVQAVSSDRSVTIVAGLANKTAQIHFGIAVQPLRQFFGGVLNPQTSGTGMQIDSGKVVVTNEYTLCAFRARIVDGGAKVVTDYMQITGAGDISRHAETQTVDTVSRATFAPDARIRLGLVSLAATHDTGADVWGVKGWRGWMSDAMLKRVWEQDKAEMQRRGIDPWWRSP